MRGILHYNIAKKRGKKRTFIFHAVVVGELKSFQAEVLLVQFETKISKYSYRKYSLSSYLPPNDQYMEPKIIGHG